MRTYLISYDLANPNAKKHALAREIMGLGAKWARPLDQTWYVATKASSSDLNDRLSWMLGEEDGLIVQEVADDAILSNTALRWFRTKSKDGLELRGAAASADETNVVPFAGHDGGQNGAVETSVAA